jgi:hypothetical protein
MGTNFEQNFVTKNLSPAEKKNGIAIYDAQRIKRK